MPTVKKKAEPTTILERMVAQLARANQPDVEDCDDVIEKVWELVFELATALGLEETINSDRPEHLDWCCQFHLGHDEGTLLRVKSDEQADIMGSLISALGDSNDPDDVDCDCVIRVVWTHLAALATALQLDPKIATDIENARGWWERRGRANVDGEARLRYVRVSDGAVIPCPDSMHACDFDLELAALQRCRAGCLSV